MRQPPSPLLLSARKRRPRRNPPQGRQFGAPSEPAPAQAQAEQPEQPEQPSQAASDEQCALLQRDPYDTRRPTSSSDDDTTSSSR